jgi:hypothetical protein
MSPGEAIRKLQRAIIVLAETGEPDPVCVAGWLRQLLEASDEVMLHQIIGVGRDYRSADKRCRRDDLLCQIKERYFSDLSNREVAHRISAEVQRYKGTAWQLDRGARRRPRGIKGDFFQILTLTDRGLSEPSVRRALDHGRPLRLAKAGSKVDQSGTEVKQNVADIEGKAAKRR